jgi:hypothetical protein
MRAFALVTLASCAALAQSPQPGHLYVARVVGDWVVSGPDGMHPLHSLERVARAARVGVRAGARADTGYTLVLRDPQSLRSATWTCNPVTRCSVERPVAQLTFSGAPIPTSPRTSALFVHVGESADERSRVKLVGARGGASDWGPIVLVADSGWLDVEPLAARLGPDAAGVVGRICPLVGDPASRTPECAGGRQVRADDCELTQTRCPFHAAAGSATAITIEVFTQAQSTLSEAPIARAFGIASSRSARQRYAALADRYRHDFDALGTLVTDAELRALQATATVIIARGRF